MNDSLKNNTTYFNLTKVKEQKYAVEIHPKPTKDDFENGFYIRYFVSQKNTNDNIIEIDKTQYDGFLDSKFYTIFNMRWMLPDDTEENMKINMDAISLLNKTYPAFRQKMRPFAMKQSTYIEAGGISATGSKDSNIVIATKRIDEIPVTQPIRTVSQVAQVSLLPPPIALSATAVKSDGFTLNWTAVSGATNYYVCVSTDSNFDSYIFQYETGYWDHKIVGNVTSVSIASILDPSIVSNTKFYYRVQSYRNGGRSNYSNTMELTTLPIYWTPPELNTDVEQNVVVWLDARYIQGVTNGFNLKQHPDGGWVGGGCDLSGSASVAPYPYFENLPTAVCATTQSYPTYWPYAPWQNVTPYGAVYFTSSVSGSSKPLPGVEFESAMRYGATEASHSGLEILNSSWPASASWQTPTASIFMVLRLNWNSVGLPGGYGAFHGTILGNTGPTSEGFQIYGGHAGISWYPRTYVRFRNIKTWDIFNQYGARGAGYKQTFLFSINNVKNNDAPYYMPGLQYANFVNSGSSVHDIWGWISSSISGSEVPPEYLWGSYLVPQSHNAPEILWRSTASLMIGGPMNYNVDYDHYMKFLGGCNAGFTGTINEIVIIKKALTTNERQLMEGYLAWKWDIVNVALSGSHPYKHSPPMVMNR